VKTFLNLTSFSPQMAFALYSFLRVREGDESEEIAQSWLAPPSLFPKGKPPEDWGYPLAIDVAEHLGFIERTEGRLRVLDGSIDSMPGFRAEVRKRVMLHAATAFEDGEDPTDELSKALTWWLHQEPQGLNSSNFEPLMDGLPFKPILQTTRWNVFERWAPFLGFAWRLDDSLIPDPTDAVEDVLDEVLPPGATLAAPDFVEALGRELPVLDGGQAFVAYRAFVNLQAPPDILRPPLSLALLRLERRGRIGFPTLADAPGVTISCLGAERRVAQVRRLEAGEEQAA
jgi:hypothetical protein